MNALLRPLCRGEGATALVAVDFRGARPGADFTQLAAEVSVPFWETVPPALAGVAVAPDADSFATAYAEALQPVIAAAGVRAVHLVGYCAGTTIAVRLAAELGRRGLTPRLTLIDPLPIGVEYLMFAYEQITRARPAEVHAELTRLSGQGPATYSYLAGRIEQHHEEQCLALGVTPDDEIARDLLDRYLGWTQFIVAANSARPDEYPGAATALLSADYGDQASRRDHWRVLRFPVAQADMLRDPAVRAAILAEAG